MSHVNTRPASTIGQIVRATTASNRRRCKRSPTRQTAVVPGMRKIEGHTDWSAHRQEQRRLDVVSRVAAGNRQQPLPNLVPCLVQCRKEREVEDEKHHLVGH